MTIDPITTFTATTAHFSGTVNSGGSEPGEATEYHFSCSPNCPGLEGFQPVTSDGNDQLVDEDATGLEPNTPYEVTLQARNAQTEAEGQPKADTKSFTTVAVASSAITGINTPDGAGGTIVTGYVNPHNSEVTDCHFEFGLSESYGQSAPCQSAPGEGGEAVEVSTDLTGLQPGSTYHFIVVATNGAGETESADGIFASNPPAGPPPPECPNKGALGVSQLPDCRAWEMVSPPDKNGGDITHGGGSIRASSTGGAVIFDSKVAFGDARGTGNVSSVTFRADRAANSWITHSLMPLQAVNSIAAVNGATYPLFTPDLSLGLLDAGDPPLVSGAPEGVPNLYLTDGAGGSPTLLSFSVNPVIRGREFYIPTPVDISTDRHHVAFESLQRLTADAPAQPVSCALIGIGCKPRVYEWDDGVVRLLSILPNGSPAAEAVAGYPGQEGTDALNNRAYSEDGSRLYFASSTNSAQAKLYLRKGHSETVLVSESEASSPDPEPMPARFLDASEDGTRAFFATEEQLLDDDTNESTDLYMYTDGPDPQHESNLTLISKDDEPGDGEDAFESGDILSGGILGVSEDGRRVYFVAEGQIIPGGLTASGGRELYLWDHGSIRYVANLSPADFLNWTHEGSKASRMTPDGKSRGVGAHTWGIPVIGSGEVCVIMRSWQDLRPRSRDG